MKPPIFIKIRVHHIEQLPHMQSALLEAIHLLTQVENDQVYSAQNSIYWLSQIAQESIVVQHDY